MSSQTTGSTRLIDFLAWVEVNKKKLAIGIALAAVVISAWAIYEWRHNEAEAEAIAALLYVQRTGVRYDDAAEAVAQTLLPVAIAHSGTLSSGRALPFVAASLLRCTLTDGAIK